MFLLTKYLNTLQLLCVLGPHFWIPVVRLHNVLKTRYSYISLLFSILTFFVTSQLRYLFVRNSYFFDDARITSYIDMFEIRMEITLRLHFVLACHCDVFLLRCNCVAYLFVVVTFFDKVRITFYFGMFELRMEITLQLRYVFACYYDVIFITSQLRYLFVREIRYILVRLNYVWK